jgi:hypothetical protein
MDEQDYLVFYPFVVVPLACHVCSRKGSYRLARLAAKFGLVAAYATLPIGSPTIARGCGGALEAPSCGAYLADLEQPRPPDLPPGRARLRLIENSW